MIPRCPVPVLALLAVGCALDSERFTTAFGDAACAHEARCEPESWRLQEGEEVCTQEVGAPLVLMEADPALAYDPEAARACLRAIQQAPCDERVAQGIWPDACLDVYTRAEAVPG